jgi:L-threonylcarbamoyladenylate synthase
VAFPTETVYGLAADATNDRAVAEVFAVKRRPEFNPLIVHVVGSEQAERLALFDDRARALAGWFWPGPLTLVLRRRPDCGLSLLVSAGLDSVALRAPLHPVAKALLARCGRPLAAPSANRSGRVSPTTAAHVAADLGDEVAMILDGGAAAIGVESTVIDLTGGEPALLRPGGLASEAIERRIGPLRPPPAGAARSPGMVGPHYSPSIPLRTDAYGTLPGEAFLGFGPGLAEADLNLSPGGSLEEAAANLFAMLRTLDRPEFAAIAVSPIPNAGLGRAINDRLRRAARASAGDDWNEGRGPGGPCLLPDPDPLDD